MKRHLFTLATAVLTASALFISGCSKDDTEAPVITLLGNNPMTISLNTTSVADPGATAEDNEDGTVSVSSDWSSVVNVNLAGTYTVTYSATDAAGNVGEDTRTVIVKNDADYLVGTYNVTEAGSPSWVQSISASTSINNRIIFSKFANYANNNTVYASVIGTAVELPSAQTVTGIGASGCTHVFTPGGTGMPVTSASGKYSFSIKFTDEQQAGGSGCTATSAVPYEDVFVQQ